MPYLKRKVSLVILFKVRIGALTGCKLGRKFAESQGCLFVEASAKTNVGVREAFLEVVEKVCFSGLFPALDFGSQKVI